MKLLNEFRQIRIAAGRSQGDIGDAIGRPQNVVSRYELGVNTPNAGLISAWADSLGYELVLRKKAD